MASEIRVNQIQSRTGVSTISFTETGPIISGVTTITGDLDVTGLISYDDVTNIDSVGLVTARNGLHVTGGSVGIGTDNPRSTLDIKSPQFNISENLNATTNNQSSGLLLQHDGGHAPGDAGAGIKFAQRWYGASHHNVVTAGIFGYKRSGNGNFGGGLKIATSNGTATNLATRITIDDSGKVGINEDNPQNSLHISGSSPTIRFEDTGANGSAFSVIEDNDGLFKIRNDAGNSGTGSGIAFEVDAGERLRIDSSGNAILKTANGAFKSENPNSSGDYVRMYAGAGTAQWDIYGNGELLRMSENSGNSAARVQFDLPTTHRSTSTTTGIAALTAQQEVNNGGYLIFDGKNSSGTSVFNVTHNGRVRVSDGIDFASTSNASGMTSELLDDYEEGSWVPSFSGRSLGVAEGTYTKIGRQVLIQFNIATLNTSISAGNISINGLPFQARNINQNGAVFIGDTSGVTYSSGYGRIYGRINGAGNSMQLLQRTNDGSTHTTSPGLGTGIVLRGYAWYTTS